ncbi:DUF6615 family protein [Paenibacillus sp. IITD108]|uniref:DUF6615 family protein n=1 Tax=Paenibacillus sp. IITD108 TaxID=3116649 RepID=UPI002F406EDD
MSCNNIETVATKKPGNVEEYKTGADFEWWFIEKKTQKSIGLRIQAKVINKICTGYNELKHKIGDQYQINVLINSALNEKMIPMYCFYSYSYSKWEPNRAWELAFAHKIKEVFFESIETVHKREAIKEHLFSAEELFCPITCIEDFVYLFGTLTNIKDLEDYVRGSVPDYIDNMLKNKQENIKKRTSGNRKRGTIFMPRVVKREGSKDILKNVIFCLKKANLNKIKNRLFDFVNGSPSQVSFVDFPTKGPNVGYIMVSLFE